MKLHILALAAHPDDVELSASGTMAIHQKMGYKTGIIDFTQGELGTRGSAEKRAQEAKKSSEILSLDVRENLKMRDGFFEITEENMLLIIQKIRQYKPEILLINAPFDRHPDHGRGSDLASRAAFLSGLIKIETSLDGNIQEPWRPKAIYRYIQYNVHKPDILVDISDVIDIKMESIMAFDSQFYNPDSEEPGTPISTKEYLDGIKNRDAEFGKYIGVQYAEGFTVERLMGVKNLFDLL
jgi:bacillithiol biosynthesis deacetylase BshB1